MSAIQKELAKATGVDIEKYRGRADVHAAIVKGVNSLSDKEWAGLSEQAQDWFNAAADVTKANREAEKRGDKASLKDVAEFPDYEDAKPSTRRRSSSDDDKDTNKSESLAVEKLKEGDRVAITTKRGKTYKGEVTEQNKRKEFVVVKGDDGEDEIDWDKVDTCETFHGAAGQEDVGPDVGDEVEFTTKRGKKVSGVISELTEETIVIGKDDDYEMDRIDGDIKIIKKGKGGGSEKPEPESRRRSSSSDSGKEDEGKGRSSNPKGTSVGGRIRELLADDLGMSKDDVSKKMKKEGIEFRDSTLNILYRDTTNFISLLREAGHLKK